jgi:hypothetical protein
MMDWNDTEKDKEEFTDEELLFVAVTGLMAGERTKWYWPFLSRQDKMILSAATDLLQKRITYERAGDMLRGKLGVKFARYCSKFD